MENRMNHQDLSRQDFFNRRAEGWLDNFYKNSDTGNHDLHSEKISSIIKTLDIEPHHRVLDMGCGAGVLVPYILDELSRDGRLVEMDYAWKMIKTNQHLHQDSRILFECAHVMDMPFDSNAFDRVICFACFPHFQDQAGAVKQITRVLKPGGKLVIAHLMSSDEIATHHKGHSPVSSDQLPSFDRLSAWLVQCGLEILEFTDVSGLYCLACVKESGQT